MQLCIDASASVPFRKRALRALYALANSNLASPPVSRALKRTAGFFVFLDLHRITVPRLYSTLHTHSGPHKLWSAVAAQEVQAKRTAVSEGATMQHPVYGLPRIPLLRTPVNKPRSLSHSHRPACVILILKT